MDRSRLSQEVGDLLRRALEGEGIEDLSTPEAIAFD
jgi:hypothetical protein